jgi:diguanylate cyclase (GGDEF)-like protein
MNRRLLTASLTVLALAGLVVAAWFLLVGGLQLLAGQKPPVWLLAVLTAVVGAAFEPCRRRIGRWIDARFYPRKLALQQLEQRLLAELAGAPSLDEVAARFVRSVRAALDVAAAALFVSDATGRYYRLRAVRGCDLEPGSLLLRAEELTPWRIQWGTRPISSAQAREHGTRLPPALDSLQAEYLVPVVFREELLGLLVLGPTRQGRALDGLDLERLEDIAERSSAMLEHARLFALASNDTVTGLSRRRIFQERLHQELVRARRSLRPFTVAIADIDDFKRLNDTWGHPAGDAALKMISRRLAAGCRRSDTVSRVGGEEFALLFPETTLEAAAQQAERLREAIAGEGIDVAPGVTVHLTLSFGVYGWQPTAEDLVLDAEELTRRADQALYGAKRGGKNRVVVYGGAEARATAPS